VGIISTVDNGNGTLTLNYSNGTSFTTGNLTGPTGPVGPQGQIGLTGPQGPAGPTGATGPIGATGPQGIQGQQGSTGANGQNGVSVTNSFVQGDSLYVTLSNGQTLNTGYVRGPQGTTGPMGAIGQQGLQGIQGPIGQTGATGPQGLAGFLTPGTNAGNTAYWDGTQWVVNSSNVYNNGGNIGIGTITPENTARLDVSSATQGFLAPRMTNVQRDAITAPADGLIIFNTSSGCPNYYNNGTWYEWCGTGVLPTGVLTSLNCGTATNVGTLTATIAASGVSSSVPYTGGNGGSYNGQTVTSTGVTGLTATLAAGTFANGAGLLTYTITGTPSASGTASFALNIGGQTCVLNITVQTLAALYPVGSVFCNGPTAIVEVTNPTTGKIWMDRNLGAIQAATSSTDVNAYGDLYQWGRRSDGHQCRNSATTTTLSSTDQPAHGDFIIGSSNWRSPQNVNLWQGVNGINNPCPSGYRIPTNSELDSERLSWSVNTSAGAFASPLKLPMAGSRNNSNGSLVDVGTIGTYWSSTVSSTDSRYLNFGSSNANMITSIRAYGLSVRCIKN
jgi:uncharacterized protein (TIGR02145 family)